MNAKIIAIANQKGGVGKTTTSVNLAACLALAGHPTLLVDMDPQSNATVGLGVERPQVQNHLYHVLLDGVPMAEALLKTNVEGLDMVPSVIDLTAAELELKDVEEREFVLKKALNPLRGRFEYVLLDCPPSLGLLTLNALVAAGSVLIPVQAEYYALRGLELLLNTISLVQKGLNPHLKVEGALITMADARASLSEQVIAEIRQMFRDKVYRTIIPRNVRLAEAPSHGKPITQYDRRSTGAEAYLQLSLEIMGKVRN